MLAHPPVILLIDTVLHADNNYGTKVSPRSHHIALVESQHYVINTAHSRRALNDGVEHRLYVGGRAANDAEHFGGCGLVLQSLLQLLCSGVLALQRFGKLLA